ncbi:hypothetical protein A0J57_03890 [Sphingobium sp. 22B]|uniref:phosphotransferase family protein n=1 Tax=unclassified Sphingobium TaxID=2611147 RepID=UPI000783B832|nr:MULTISPECIES: phosphotransferase family protein [unclassified Sphingobium]KXU33790.1 hypothetical protein AXW74_00440 [Sphingobium sp. AM]KYC33735.1 hypothetical protein A0J57_03890 [Sphingobium sp. 22B]OAP33475.1 hypothetical protein A8O16_03110 [Sphingobium sp. 20006FA]
MDRQESPSSRAPLNRISQLLGVAARDLAKYVEPQLDGEALEIVSLLRPTLLRLAAQLGPLEHVAAESCTEYQRLAACADDLLGRGSDVAHDAGGEGGAFARLLDIRAALAASIPALSDRAGGQGTKADAASRLLAAIEEQEARWGAREADAVAYVAQATDIDISSLQQVRDRLQPDVVTGYLRRAAPEFAKIEVGSVNVLPGGRSKSTIFITASGFEAGSSLVLRQDIESAFIRTRVSEEAPLLRLLKQQGVPVPTLFLCERDNSELGPPFILTDRVAGKPMGSAFGFIDADPAHVRSLAGILARIHATPVSHLPPALLGGGISPADRLRRRIRQAWDEWRANTREVSPRIEMAFARIHADSDHVAPAEALVHSDFGPHNLLADGNGVSAVLDWELALLGDPAEDLAYCRSAVEQVMPWTDFLEEYYRCGGNAVSEQRLELFRPWGALRNAWLTAKAMNAFSEGRVGSANGLITYVAMPYFNDAVSPAG